MAGSTHARPDDSSSAVQAPDNRSRRATRFRRELLGYCAAAAALAGAAEEADASVVYKDFPDVTVGADSPPFELDLDGDAAADFLADFTLASGVLSGERGNALAPWTGGATGGGTSGGGCPSGGSCGGGGATGGRLSLLAGNRRRTYAVASATFTGGGGPTAGFNVLPRGHPIDGQLGFASAGGLVLTPASGFLGLRFAIGSEQHFGWLRIDHPDATTLTLYDAAYESRPLTAIAAGAVPEPASLAVLALGAAGLALWRRRGPG